MLNVTNKPVMLSVVMLSVVILNVVMLNVVMLNVVMLYVVIPSVVAALKKSLPLTNTPAYYENFKNMDEHCHLGPMLKNIFVRNLRIFVIS